MNLMRNCFYATVKCQFSKSNYVDWVLMFLNANIYKTRSDEIMFYNKINTLLLTKCKCFVSKQSLEK